MQERERLSNMDIRAYTNRLQNNPKFTDEILRLVEADLQYGLSIEETEIYTSKHMDASQMRVYSECLRRGYSEEVRDCIAQEILTGEQMLVALEFYEKGVALETISDVIQNGERTAFVMRRLFQQVISKVEEAKASADTQDAYAQALMKQIEAAVEKITFQEKRYDALNEKLSELQIQKQEDRMKQDFLALLKEKDALLEQQQDELNRVRAVVLKLQQELEEVQKQKAEAESQRETAENQRKEAEDRLEKEREKGQTIIPITQYQSQEPSHYQPHTQYQPQFQPQPKPRKSFLSRVQERFHKRKRINIVKLVAEKDLQPDQLMQLQSAIERGLTEEQLLVLINNQVPAEQMAEIINIADYENRNKGDHR